MRKICPVARASTLHCEPQQRKKMMEKSVFIVDDDDAVLDSIKELVESVGLIAMTYSSPQTFLDFFQPEYSGCLVLDVRMAEMSGLELHKKLIAMQAKIPVIFITGHGDVPMAVAALQNGATDFLQKPYRDQDLLDAINKAMSRSDTAMTDGFDERLAMLTSRELEVYEKLLDGSSSKMIARDLDVSPRTIDAHRHNLLHKLRFNSVKDLIVQRMTLDRDR